MYYTNNNNIPPVVSLSKVDILQQPYCERTLIIKLHKLHLTVSYNQTIADYSTLNISHITINHSPVSILI